MAEGGAVDVTVVGIQVLVCPLAHCQGHFLHGPTNRLTTSKLQSKCRCPSPADKVPDAYSTPPTISRKPVASPAI